MSNSQQSYQDFGQEPIRILEYKDGLRTVKIRSRLMPWYLGSFYDIPYFHALGWLQGQRLNRTVFKDYAAAEALSKTECQRIKSLENFDDDTFTFIYHRDDR